jgi:Macroglobulin domain MG4
MFKGFSQPLETTVQVVDMDGKPVANRTVRITKPKLNSSIFIDSTQVKQELVTNSEGKAIFNYNLSISDSNQDFVQFFAKDDNTWKAITFVELSLSNNKQSKIIKNEIQVKMDSLKSLKIRLSSNRNDLISYSISANLRSGEFPQDRNTIERNIDFFNRDRVPSSIDTTFTIKIFSKHSFSISASLGYISEPKIWPYRTIFTDKMNRDSIYWIKLL